MQLTEELLGPDANNYGGAGLGKKAPIKEALKKSMKSTTT
jgi:hypothetical protein